MCKSVGVIIRLYIMFIVLRLTSIGSPRLIILLLDILNRVYTYGLIICTKKHFQCSGLLLDLVKQEHDLQPVTVPPDSFKKLDQHKISL